MINRCGQPKRTRGQKARSVPNIYTILEILVVHSQSSTRSSDLQGNGERTLRRVHCFRLTLLLSIGTLITLPLLIQPFLYIDRVDRAIQLGVAMSIRLVPTSCDFRDFVFCIVFFGSLLGIIVAQEVTLDSIRIYTTHEWLPTKPTVYFQCKGENKTVLPDVKKTNVSYTFRGEESWQPLTELKGTKCKRCGIYEQDTFNSGDTFDEWELCPSDFTPEGKYTHIKEKEFNATFLCNGCSPVGAGSNKESISEKEEERRGMHPVLVILIVLLVLGVVLVGLLVGYKYWRKKKRQQEQARFLKLFEDGDELEDELGLEDSL